MVYQQKEKRTSHYMHHLWQHVWRTGRPIWELYVLGVMFIVAALLPMSIYALPPSSQTLPTLAQLAQIAIGFIGVMTIPLAAIVLLLIVWGFANLALRHFGNLIRYRLDVAFGIAVDDLQQAESRLTDDAIYVDDDGELDDTLWQQIKR